MPIRPELRKFYGKEWQTIIRPRILARAKNRCEQCRVPNAVGHRIIHRGPEGMWRLTDAGASWHRNHGGLTTFEPLWTLTHTVRIVLTVAHLNHVAGEDRDDNLKALCQWCHLNYDRLHHKETRCTRKDAARPLLAGAGS